ncbi:MAG: cysteine desulfurase [Clostridia bacterium]|nr:cysteine desulfurase [Clostridia bacterium]
MIYLDNASTTPLDSVVLDKMMPYLTENFANPASQYAAGQSTALAVLNARDKIAKLIGCKSEELYFVSGGTEAGNWALKGACAAQDGNHIIVSAIEHPALIESAKDLQKFGYEVSFVNPDKNGVISPEDIKKAIRNDTVFCAVMHANNETGVIQPVDEIGAICFEHGVFYYCDCVQTAGVLPFPTKHCSALGISAHKFYGPKGFGAIYISERAKINRLISGGKQERGLRAGTTNTAAAVGCAFALENAVKLSAEHNEKIIKLRDEFVDRVLSEIDGTHLNGGENRLPAHANISFDGCDGENILFLLDMKGIAVSTGSACSAGAVKESHVLKAMGLDKGRVKSAVRFTFGKYNTEEEVNTTVEELKRAVQKIRGC